jgi:hypothetical protein
MYYLTSNQLVDFIKLWQASQNILLRICMNLKKQNKIKAFLVIYQVVCKVLM